ncbi:GDYXXLXY domain-containing protein [Fusobacterium sp.]|uniref:GDYXXLXY domain-containing protein n=1 Tax=Fusobacterium sp. TaxID=68766 RepID=UPI0025C72E1A|nr:GDYXXLXY domain-containing protein [Fusobacterium sp.]MCI5724770.1 GDYXXLXY domain-containing protein [Fusobacterium sp.]
MKTKMKTTLIIFNFILLLVLTSFSAFKEESYKKGDYFYLKLAPVDPRSLIQGDYMILNYEIVDELWARLNNTKNNMKVGYIVAKIDENKVAHFIDVVDKPFDDKNLIFIKFKSNSYNIKINADSFLFQEGEAKTYENAKYSKVVIVNNVLRLVDLVNEI